MGGQTDAVVFTPGEVVTELERVTFAAKVLSVSATLETVEEVEVCEVANVVDEVELPGTDEPRELEWSLGVEIPELEAVDPMLTAEYDTIPAASTTATIAAIHVGRIDYRSCGHRLLNPWFQCSITVCQHCTLSSVLISEEHVSACRGTGTRKSHYATIAISETQNSTFEPVTLITPVAPLTCWSDGPANTSREFGWS